ncbi:MAG: EAL domain-containing protein [Dehalococcoidia bacterium]
MAAALETREFVLHFQPIVSRGGDLVSIEALLRWRRPTGLLVARQFFARAQSGGVLVHIDRELVVEGCRFARELQRSGYPHLRLAVNVPLAELLPSGGGTDWLRTAISESGLRPDSLEIEVREQEIRTSDPEVVRLFEHLASTGLHVTLDDFWAVAGDEGSIGLPAIRAVKLDLWSNTGSAASRDALLRAARVARKRGVEVVAKRVETEYEAQLGNELDVDAYQGFVHGVPTSAGELRRDLVYLVESDAA